MEELSTSTVSSARDGAMSTTSRLARHVDVLTEEGLRLSVAPEEVARRSMSTRGSSGRLHRLREGPVGEERVVGEHVMEALDGVRRVLGAVEADAVEHGLLANAARAVVQLLERDPGQLRVAHLAVAVLAHPALNQPVSGPRSRVEAAVLVAMDRLSMSAAFEHTALAALQNAASTAECDRDAVVQTVASVMKQHNSNSGILLRGIDLIAFHLEQPVSRPAPETCDIVVRVIVAAGPKLTALPQGASTAMLALVGAARQSLSFSNESSNSIASSAARFSRSISPGIVDAAYASTVVASMNKHRAFAPVQILACEAIAVATSGSSSASKASVREFYSAGAVPAILAAMHIHPHDVKVVERALDALRSIILTLQGLSNRSARLPVNISVELLESIVRGVDEAARGIASKDTDLSAAAKSFASELSGGSTMAPFLPAKNHRSNLAGDAKTLSSLGRRIARRLGLGTKGKDSSVVQRHAREADSLRNSGFEYYNNCGPQRMDPLTSSPHGRSSSSMMSGRSSALMQDLACGLGFKSSAEKGAFPHAGNKSSRRRVSCEDQCNDSSGQVRVMQTRRWRSVSDRLYSRGRRSSAASNSASPGRASENIGAPSSNRTKHDRHGPLTLTGSELANLSRQPSRVFYPQPTQIVGVGPEDSSGVLPLRTKKRVAAATGEMEELGF